MVITVPAVARLAAIARRRSGLSTCGSSFTSNLLNHAINTPLKWKHLQGDKQIVQISPETKTVTE